MAKRLIHISLILTLVVLAASEAAAQTTPIAHWTFNASDITVGASGITAASDVAGSTINHDATTMFGGTGGAGGPQINSVTGQFGDAASFTNANANGAAQANFAWMSFPQLTEISGPSGGDFSVSAWVNVPDQASWDDNPILADWGNAAANTNRFTYWFQLDNVDGNAALRPRAQLRAANTPIAPMNIDIVATTLSAAQAGTNGGVTEFDNGAWHHLAWTWTKAAGEMRFYTDGQLRHTQMSGQTGDNLNLLISDSLVGALGAKRDNNRYFTGAMDEVWVVSGALTDAEVLDGFTCNFCQSFPTEPINLDIQVNTTSGNITLRNPTADPIEFSSYRIVSSSESLNTAGWDPIATGTPVAGFPQGNGTGNGWEVAPNADGGEMVEWYLTGSSTLANGGTINLGAAFHPTVATLNGDYNDNGAVDAADYAVWRNAAANATLPNDPTPGVVDASDYATWRAAFGKRSGQRDLIFQYTLAGGQVRTGTISYLPPSGGGASALVPEPTTAGLMFVAALAGFATRRRP